MITPILKKPSLDKDELCNYRPVSNLRYLSKLIERVVSTQLKHHINKYSLADPLQSAYKADHSTETALLCIQNDILKVLDSNKAMFLVMLDLSAAFDTLDHSTMLRRLQNQFGIHNTALKWFTSYFHNRTSHVTVSGADSDVSHIHLGIPQGSVIGPLTFIMYLSPVGDIIRQHSIKYHTYADDIKIYMDFDPSIPNEAECALFRLSNCITDVQNGLIANKLLLNKDKTECLRHSTYL